MAKVTVKNSGSQKIMATGQSKVGYGSAKIEKGKDLRVKK